VRRRVRVCDHAPAAEVVLGDARRVLPSVPPESARSCVTSPPYWGLRDYGQDGQIGAERSLDEYVEKLVRVFREVRRCLTRDGTLWLVVGDGYTSGGRTWRDSDRKNPARRMSYRPPTPRGMKPKDLLGVPWLLAFALRADGWYLRSDVIWHKPNCQPESVRDRPTRSHEYVFLMSKSGDYHYDAEAVSERASGGGARNRRTVWSIGTEACPTDHPAAFPAALVETCLAAGTEEGDLVLDPFCGSGTVGEVALRMGRRFLGMELKRKYAEAARRRMGLTVAHGPAKRRRLEGAR